MRERLEQRLQELKSELETGQKMLMALEQKRSNLEQTILRISGAIQVLEELLTTGAPVLDRETMLSGSTGGTSAQ